MYLEIQVCPKGCKGLWGAELMAWTENQNWRENSHHGVQKKSTGVDVGRWRIELLSFCFSGYVSVAKLSCTANP